VIRQSLRSSQQSVFPASIWWRSEGYLSPLVGREAFIGNGGPGDVAAEFLELVALVGITDSSGVERKAGLFSEQG